MAEFKAYGEKQRAKIKVLKQKAKDEAELKEESVDAESIPEDDDASEDLVVAAPPPPPARLRNAVVALDAISGEVLWRYDEDVWNQQLAAGDTEKYNERAERARTDVRTDTMCSPETQGTPLIAGDGTVYMSSGHGGELRAIRDVNQDGVIDPKEVSTFSTHNAFLNSPSLAPGMLVAAPCWGPVYVFKNTKKI